MSRGRHRHSSVLGRAVPPTAAAVLVMAAVTALVFSRDPVLVRSVGVAAVLAALGVTVLLRRRDQAARAAADVAAAQRLRAEERFEEQLAETEYAAEVAEERATRFGRRLTAEKSRLAKAETEIARLLRERAVAVAEQALKEAEATQRALAAARPKHPVSPAAYVRAASVLRHLERQAAALDAQRERAARAELSLRARSLPAAVPVAAPAAAPVVPAQPVPGAAVPAAAVAEEPSPRGVRAVGASPVRPVLTASVEQLGGAPVAVLRSERQRPRTPQAGPVRGQNFSFFGRAGAAVRAAAPAPAVGSVSELGERADLADVVGDEAVAASARYEAEAARAAEGAESVAAPVAEAPAEHRRPGVVDLTADDETEVIELPELRASR